MSQQPEKFWNKYPRYIDLGPFSCDLPAKMSEWIYRFAEALASGDGDVTVARQLFDETTKPFYTLYLVDGRSTPVDVVLALTTETDGLHILVAFKQSDKVEVELLEIVRDAGVVASGKLGDAGALHAWSAIIGRHPESIWGGLERLTKKTKVGGLELESTDTVLLEPNTTNSRSLSSWATSVSVPIRITGSSVGYSWSVAEKVAGRSLHTLCGILSIGWGKAPVVVREAAAPTEWGPRTVPEKVPWYNRHDDTVNGLESAADIEVPTWADDAYRRAEGRAYVKRALDAYLEGAVASARHPSLASVAFVTAIETVAARIYKVPKCRECGATQGLAQSFQATVERFGDPEDVAMLSSSYSVRSKIVHTGHFVGGETTPGVHDFDLWSPSVTQQFGLSLFRLEQVARKVVRWALQNDIPPRIVLPSTPT